MKARIWLFSLAVVVSSCVAPLGPDEIEEEPINPLEVTVAPWGEDADLGVRVSSGMDPSSPRPPPPPGRP